VREIPVSRVPGLRLGALACFVSIAICDNNIAICNKTQEKIDKKIPQAGNSRIHALGKRAAL
jgi:hypothetical protein